jgi:hypothetical protein
MALHDDLLNLAIRLVGSAPVAPIPVTTSVATVSAAVPVPAATPAPAVTAVAPPAPTPPVATPTEAELRRAISTAYYALFHLLIDAATTRGVTTAALRSYVARNFEHRAMLAVCRRYTQRPVDMTGQPIPAEIKRIADNFTQLQDARHKADYNVKDSVTSSEAQTFVQLARDSFTDWVTVVSDPAADTFLTELLVGGIKER